jgi:hypothetical protein
MQQVKDLMSWNSSTPEENNRMVTEFWFRKLSETDRLEAEGYV